MKARRGAIKHLSPQKRGDIVSPFLIAVCNPIEPF
jgi:hypothetical protein